MVSFNDRLSITLFISLGHFSDGLLKKEPKVKRDSFRISVLLNINVFVKQCPVIL